MKLSFLVFLSNVLIDVIQLELVFGFRFDFIQSVHQPWQCSMDRTNQPLPLSLYLSIYLEGIDYFPSRMST